ncbi:formylglycine-generating enzyme required for sulfatase activity [Rhodoblastus acidophilus]|uniref:formylglycine-generating enzyme family protein n=1 Tax=Rhodoblastus acidophilus TaxID=1074 RepID=UPI0022246346|nr:formylglycine-generating enzyme family protein [Rhodoblastus acidophilus]MCW2316722.1 formylglycine-generating enzyme required for sulfatase activity [Rhodoblastus acidophilus]
MARRAAILAAFLAVFPSAAAPACAAPAEMAPVPAGAFTPFFKMIPAKGQRGAEPRPIALKAFRLDRFPVTSAQFAAFLATNPQWRREAAPRLFVDPNYLRRWREGAPAAGEAQAPVTNVSWFAAQAFCEARGGRLPTTDEWEYALADAGRGRDQVTRISLDWFARPNGARLGEVGQGAANGYGLSDMVGLVWEWTEDFSATGSGAEQRNTSSKDDAAFCGGGAAGVRDPADYPAFMRYALRASLKARYTQDNLGFRCAGDE